MFTRAQQNRVKFDQGHHPVHFAMSSQAKTHHAGLQKNVGTHWKLINIITKSYMIFNFDIDFEQ